MPVSWREEEEEERMGRKAKVRGRGEVGGREGEGWRAAVLTLQEKAGEGG